MKRREFMKAAGVGTIGAGLAGCGAASDAGDANCPDTSVTAAAVSDRQRFNYVGPDADAQGGYFKFMAKPATTIDFGLSPADEERAAELHKTLHIFDSEPEVGYHPNLIDNLLASGAGSVAGSFTMDALPHDLINGMSGDDVRIRPADWWARATLESNLAFMDKVVAYKGDQVQICTSHADLLAAQAAGKVGMMFDCQNTMFIRNDLEQLEIFYEKGVRRVQLSYNQQMQAASGCMEPRDGGATMWGARVIGKLNEMNMLVDTGHCSSMTLSDAIDISESPIACSHAGMRSIAPDNPRTHTDEGLKKLADNGGVFGVVGVPGTLIPGSSEASVADFVDAIDRAVNLMGVEHVGFALDQIQAPTPDEFFTSPDWPPEAAASVSVTDWPWSDTFYGMENQSGYINLTRGLVAKGYSDEDIRKVMGQNHLRLIKEVVG